MRSSSHSLGVGAMSRSTSTSLSYSLVVLRDTCAFTLSSVTHRVTHADAARLVVRRRLPALFLFCFCTWPILSASSARRRARVGALVLPGIKRPKGPDLAAEAPAEAALEATTPKAKTTHSCCMQHTDCMDLPLHRRADSTFCISLKMQNADAEPSPK